MIARYATLVAAMLLAGCDALTEQDLPPIPAEDLDPIQRGEIETPDHPAFAEPRARRAGLSNVPASEKPNIELLIGRWIVRRQWTDPKDPHSITAADMPDDRDGPRRAVGSILGLYRGEIKWEKWTGEPVLGKGVCSNPEPSAQDLAPEEVERLARARAAMAMMPTPRGAKPAAQNPDDITTRNDGNADAILADGAPKPPKPTKERKAPPRTVMQFFTCFASPGFGPTEQRIPGFQMGLEDQIIMQWFDRSYLLLERDHSLPAPTPSAPPPATPAP